MLEDVVALDCVEDSDGSSTGEWIAAEGCPVHARVEGFRGLFGAEHCAHGNAAGDGLGEGGDIGKDAVVLVGEPFAGAANAALDFVGDQECAGYVAKFAGSGVELLRDGMNAAFALNCFEQDRAVIFSERGPQCGDVIKWNEVDGRDKRREGFTILGLMSGRDRAHAAAMKAVFERDELRSDGAALFAEHEGVRAGELHRSLPCLGAGVAEEDPIETAHLG